MQFGPRHLLSGGLAIGSTGNDVVPRPVALADLGIIGWSSESVVASRYVDWWLIGWNIWAYGGSSRGGQHGWSAITPIEEMSYTSKVTHTSELVDKSVPV